MPDTATTVSIIALVVALVALVTTISQALGQFLATADGYRRCQPSVIGGWAKFTHRRFRWTEGRFETLYVTPSFHVETVDHGHWEAPPTFIDGSSSSKRDTYCEYTHDFSKEYSEMASWVSLIETLQLSAHWLRYRLQSQDPFHLQNDPVDLPPMVPSEKTHLERLSLPTMRLVRRSWDFVPPEVVRPLATIGISDVAIIARRLGMLWKQFEPSEGNLKAEGNGHTITSSIVRSIGTVLQLNLQKWNIHPEEKRDNLYVPSEPADQMGFGIVAANERLNLPAYQLGTEADVLTLLRRTIDPSRTAYKRLKRILDDNPGWTPGISDIISLASPMIRLEGSNIIRVPQPSAYVVGYTQRLIGFRVFHRRLGEMISTRRKRGIAVSSQTANILQQYEELLDQYGALWEDPNVGNQQLNNRPVAFLDDLHARHNATTEYFFALSHDTHYNPRDKGVMVFHYKDLIYSHITHAVKYFPEAQDRVHASPSQARPTYDLRGFPWQIEGAHIYFDNIPKIADSMKERGFDNPVIVEEAWLTMMFRAFLWHRCHFMVDGPRVPTEYWGSKLPVYIG